MIYLVYGFPRSGTSMMMRACIAGGMQVGWSAKREELVLANSDGSYQVNEAVLEPDVDTVQDWPEMYDGMAVKILPWQLGQLPPHEYRAVVMRRDPGEISASYYAAFHSRWLSDAGEDYEQLMQNAVAHMRSRPDVLSVVECHYEAIVSRPEAEMRRIAESGWPLDARQAASVVDVSKWRFRANQLAKDTSHAIVHV